MTGLLEDGVKWTCRHDRWTQIGKANSGPKVQDYSNSSLVTPATAALNPLMHVDARSPRSLATYAFPPTLPLPLLVLFYAMT